MQYGEEKVYTVTALTRLIKYTLEESFPSIWVEGEISNYICHSSGHRYLILKDENAAIKLTIWRSIGQTLKFEPENGMKVRAYGDISVYEKGGNYQLNVRKLTPVGIGELEIAFRQLYEKLSREGLFDEAIKKPIPEYPMKIGIVTSPTGAAIRDIIQIAGRRNKSVELLIYPARVQGEGAGKTIIAGIEYFNRRSDIELIIIGRGGGSLEDLWAFNEEELVRAIHASEKPIVSAVGHEIDTTLSDLAADLRAPTPSAAAELVIWSSQEFLNEVTTNLVRIDNCIISLIIRNKDRLGQVIGRPVYHHPELMVHEKMQYLDNLLRLFDNAGKNNLEKRKNLLSLALSRLETLSPLAILKRGYAVLNDISSGKPIKSVGGVEIGQSMEAVLSDGKIEALVKRISKN
nr:exodeoxyribonuclease VII large subunit [candidate division Zixibacteria bacterium]